jgi:hypothetical protein
VSTGESYVKDLSLVPTTAETVRAALMLIPVLAGVRHATEEADCHEVLAQTTSPRMLVGVALSNPKFVPARVICVPSVSAAFGVWKLDKIGAS